MSVEDRELVRGWLRGDAAAFEALVDRHQEALLRFASRLTGCPDLAQDLVQETFLKLVREAPSLDAVEGLGAWLLKVCRNLCVDRIRKESRMQVRQRQAAVPEVVQTRPELEVEDERATVRAVLQGLDARDREVLELKVYENQTYRQIQAITGHTLHQVHQSVHRGLRQLAAGMRAAERSRGVRS